MPQQLGDRPEICPGFDQTLRVHGLDNLWVADASIMPAVAHANTNPPAIMIGERVVDAFTAAGR